MGPFSILICVVCSIVGAGMGLFSGLVPGIHVNTLASVMLASYPAMEELLSGIVGEGRAAAAVSCCIMSAAVVHSFVDFVPSVFIGAPDSDDHVAMLPGHRLLLQGRGMAAVRAAAVGSLVGASAAVTLAVPLQWVMMAGCEEFLDGLTPVVVTAAASIILLGQFRKGCGIQGAVLFCLSGTLGVAVMDLGIPSDGILGEGTLLFPMLSGLFGMPVLLTSASGGDIPRQSDASDVSGVHAAGVKGVVMGCIAGWFPGITSTVGASISACFMPENRPERFISTVASIGTVTSILSLVTLSVSGSGRSGICIVIGDMVGDSIGGFASETFLMLILTAGIASALGYALTIASGKAMAGTVGRVDSRRLGLGVAAFTVVLVHLFTGPWGVAILAISTMIGFLAPSYGTDRTVLCGCLLLPVILMQVGL